MGRGRNAGDDFRMTPIEVTEEEGLRAYARMMNHLSVDYLAPLLADDFQYESQWVFSPISSKADYLNYITPKLETLKRSGSRVWAEMAELHGHPNRPCLVLAQGDKNNLVATLLMDVAQGKVRRADLCLVPPPESAARTGEYPL